MTSAEYVSPTLAKVRRTLVVGVVVAAVGLVLSSSLLPHASHAESSARLAQPVAAAPAVTLANAAVAPVATTPAPVLVKGLPDFTELVEKVGPSVVSIRTTQRVAEDAGEGDEADAQMREFFKRFFGMPMPPNQRRSPGTPAPKDGEGEERPHGVGSGFVLSSDGYVLTNAHVVDGADEVYVNLTDKREFKAKVVGVDKRTDVAVLKIDAKQLPAVAIGDVSKLKVGEWVIAIGTPFGLDNTVTAGIVSAKSRDTGEEIRFIQSDAAVNPGNSGGPLINMRGEVVGINSQILSRSGGYMGISFSIPIDDAMKVADQLRSGGHVVRGRIGVSIGPVSKEVADSIGLGKPVGAMVQGVQDGTPAQRAGVEPGDIITKFDGRSIDSAGDLSRMVGATKPGTRSSIEVFRRGSYKTLSLTVAEMDAETASAEGGNGAAPKELAASGLGLSLSDLSSDQKRELGRDVGVLVQTAQGPAARAGLRAGDVILAIANVEVKSVKEFEAVLKRLAKSHAVSVLVRRGDLAQFAVIYPSAH